MACSGVPAFNKVITLVFNFVHKTLNNDLNVIYKLLKHVHSVHSDLRVIAGVTRNQAQTLNKANRLPTVKFIGFKKRYACMHNDLFHFTVL